MSKGASHDQDRSPDAELVQGLPRGIRRIPRSEADGRKGASRLASIAGVNGFGFDYWAALKRSNSLPRGQRQDTKRPSNAGRPFRLQVLTSFLKCVRVPRIHFVRWCPCQAHLPMRLLVSFRCRVLSCRAQEHSPRWQVHARIRAAASAVLETGLRFLPPERNRYTQEWPLPLEPSL